MLTGFGLKTQRSISIREPNNVYLCHVVDMHDMVYKQMEYIMSNVNQYNDIVRDALKKVEKPCSVLLRIVWADSSMDSQWKDINDTKPELSICESVGWLACVSDDVVTIAPNKTVCDDAKDIQITAMMHIPIASIQKFAIIEGE